MLLKLCEPLAKLIRSGQSLTNVDKVWPKVLVSNLARPMRVATAQNLSGDYLLRHFDQLLERVGLLVECGGRPYSTQEHVLSNVGVFSGRLSGDRRGGE